MTFLARQSAPWRTKCSSITRLQKEEAMATTQQDPVSVDPKHYTVELENDRVRVVRIRYGAGEKSEMHSHPESVIVFMTDAVARFSYPDGSSEEITGTAGQVLSLPATTHLPENVSNEPFEVVQVELKG
jgi:quercetin dioxygenase-like cupin family protein